MNKVSVIIPNYNHAPYLEERIRSAVDQTIVPDEIIIMDDCSPDNSREIIEAFVRQYPDLITPVYNEKNTGNTFVQWNKGVEMATNEIIWIAESDDMADKEFLACLLPLMNEQSTGLAFCDAHIIDEKGKITGNSRKWMELQGEAAYFLNTGIYSGEETFERFAAARNIIPNASGCIFRKSVYQKAGGADTSLKLTGDWKLWSSLIYLSDVGYCYQSLNYHRRHAQTVTHQKKSIHKEEALQNLNYFYKLAQQKQLDTNSLLEKYFEWHFKDNLWDKRYQFTMENTKRYLNQCDQVQKMYLLKNMPKKFIKQLLT